MEQRILTSANNYSELDKWLEDSGITKLFLVCDRSFEFLTGIRDHISELISGGHDIVKFDHFHPNPIYESVEEGVRSFVESGCDGIMAIGGGSAIDVAKCVKLYSNLDHSINYLEQTPVPNNIPFIVMPTTAGTGSEATRYAVIYYEDKKQSITDDSILPHTVLMDSSAVKTLPMYHKKSTMMDAFCHAIESFWSINSTEESKEYSKAAIRLVIDNMDAYLDNTDEGNSNMLSAAHLAGKAINITQTTAGHAMCYKITSLFGVAHGHAAILCDRILFRWMIDNTDRCIDQRGEEYVKGVFGEIAVALGCNTPYEAADKVAEIFDRLELDVPVADDEQFEILKDSVNPVRLKNNPVALSTEIIDELYHKILRGEQNEG